METLELKNTITTTTKKPQWMGSTVVWNIQRNNSVNLKTDNRNNSV